MLLHKIVLIDQLSDRFPFSVCAELQSYLLIWISERLRNVGRTFDGRWTPVGLQSTKTAHIMTQLTRQLHPLQNLGLQINDCIMCVTTADEIFGSHCIRGAARLGHSWRMISATATCCFWCQWQLAGTGSLTQLCCVASDWLLHQTADRFTS
jgi:hypothetical protein